MTEIEFDAANLARAIREMKVLPITDIDAERLARALETAGDDEEFLASALSAIRFLVDQLERSPARTGIGRRLPGGASGQLQPGSYEHDG